MIPLVDLTAQYHSIKKEMDAAVLATLESGHFILGPQVTKFEESVAAYLGVSTRSVWLPARRAGDRFARVEYRRWR